MNYRIMVLRAHERTSMAIDRQMCSKTYIEHFRIGTKHVLHRRNQYNRNLHDVCLYSEGGLVWKESVDCLDGPGWYELRKRELAVAYAGMAMELDR